MHGLHYCFSRYRPVTGQEELLLHGLPLNRMELKMCYDLDVIKMAASAVPAPVMRAELIAVLLAWGFARIKSSAPTR